MINNSTYGENYYTNRYKDSYVAASKILKIIYELSQFRSVIDVGCGNGVWLKIATENYSINEACGIDGHWVNKNKFLANCRLHHMNLEKKIKLNNKYDICICLEVAEHLSQQRSNSFVNDLEQLSDNIIFGAAIPFQGGRNHINEQPQEFWIKKFEEKGYKCVDCIRSKIWSFDDIPFWYKQNTFLFSKNLQPEVSEIQIPANLVHPQLFEIYSNPGIIQTLRFIRKLPLKILKKLFFK